MENPTEIIAVELSDKTVVNIEVTPIGEQRVSACQQSFEEVKNTIKSIAIDIAETMRNVQKEINPDKISVKLGLEVAIESGQLTALIVKGASKANLEITMEWGKNDTAEQVQKNAITPNSP